MDDMKKMKMLKVTYTAYMIFFKQLKYIEPFFKSINVNFSSNNNNSF